MPHQRNRFLDWLVSYVSIGFGALTACLPLSVSRVLGRLLGSVAYYVVPRVRSVGLDNLTLAYGDALSTREKRCILKRSLQSLGTVAAEFSRIPRLRSRYGDALVSVEGVEHYDLSKAGIIVGGHMGNWEWIAPSLVKHGFKLAQIVRPFNQPILNAAIDRTRRAGKNITIPKANAGPEVVRLLMEGYCVGLAIDQCPNNSAVPIRFFGHEAWATIGSAFAAMRLKVPVHPLSMIRQPDGNYLFRIEPAIHFVDSGDTHADILENTQRCQDAIERQVREHPEQWLWIHRRWKPRPKLAQEWAEREKKHAESLRGKGQ